MIIDLIKSRCFYLEVTSQQFSLKDSLHKVYFDSPSHVNASFSYGKRDLNSIKYIIPSDYIHNIKNNIDDSNVSKIYFYEKSVFPRNLLSLFDNIKKVNKINTADYIIVNEDIEFDDGYIYIHQTTPLNNVYIFYNKYNNEYFYLSTIPYLIKQDNPNINDREYIELLYSENVIDRNFELIFSGNVEFITTKDLGAFTLFLNNENKIIHDKDFSKYIISHLPDITDDIFDNIVSLFKSRDTNNIQMAFKILSGHNFQKRACQIGEAIYLTSRYRYYIPPCVSSKFVLNNIGLNSWHDCYKKKLIDILYCSKDYSTSMSDYLYAKNITKKFIEENIEFAAKSLINTYNSYNFTLEYDLK